MNTQIKTPTNVRNANGFAVNLRSLRARGEAYELWRSSDGAVAYDANTLVFGSRAEAEAFCRPDSAEIYPVYYCSAKDGGFAIWDEEA